MLRILARLILVGPVLTLALAGARADVALPLHFEMRPAEQVRAAVAATYGGALIAECGARLKANADTACLTAKRIDDAAFAARGREIVERYGTRLVAAWINAIDPAVYDAE